MTPRPVGRAGGVLLCGRKLFGGCTADIFARAGSRGLCGRKLFRGCTADIFARAGSRGLKVLKRAGGFGPTRRCLAVRAEALQRLHRGHLCTCGKTRVEGVEASWRPRANTTSCQQHLMGKSQSGHGQVTVRSQSGLSQVSVRSTVRSTVRSGFSIGKSICVRPPTKSLYHVYIHACLRATASSQFRIPNDKSRPDCRPDCRPD